MKFKNPKTGEIYWVIRDNCDASGFCSAVDCSECPINGMASNCSAWVNTNPYKAARLMGYEVVEEESFVNTKQSTNKVSGNNSESKPTAKQIADLILFYRNQYCPDISIPNLKLQYLLWFVQLDYLDQYGELLFNDEFTSSKAFPIVRDVYDEYISYGGMDIFKEKDPPTIQFEIQMRLIPIMDRRLGYSIATLQKEWERETQSVSALLTDGSIAPLTIVIVASKNPDRFEERIST